MNSADETCDSETTISDARDANDIYQTCFHPKGGRLNASVLRNVTPPTRNAKPVGNAKLADEK